MVALAILLLATTGIGWKLHRVVEKRKFTSDLKALRIRLLTCQKLAMNMQADWQGVLKKEKNQWVFVTRCVDQPNAWGFSPLSLHSFTTFFDGERVEEWSIEFSATGEVFPKGTLLFVQSDERKEAWEIPKIFQKESQAAQK